LASALFLVVYEAYLFFVRWCASALTILVSFETSLCFWLVLRSIFVFGIWCASKLFLVDIEAYHYFWQLMRSALFVVGLSVSLVFGSWCASALFLVVFCLIFVVRTFWWVSFFSQFNLICFSVPAAADLSGWYLMHPALVLLHLESYLCIRRVLSLIFVCCCWCASDLFEEGFVAYVCCWQLMRLGFVFVRFWGLSLFLVGFKADRCLWQSICICLIFYAFWDLCLVLTVDTPLLCFKWCFTLLLVF